VKIGPVDTEVALLRVKKEEITEGKIYSPVGRFAERAKLNTTIQTNFAYLAPKLVPIATSLERSEIEKGQMDHL